MSILNQLKPRNKNRVYDMVRDAGVDVSDWEKSKGNALSTAANPKYCYNWSFVQSNEVVVLSLWYSDLKEKGEAISNELNMRNIAKESKGVIARRATEMDGAIQEAYRKDLLVRIILCEGTKRDRNDPKSTASKVHLRSLDLEPWHVAQYDMATGQATLMRGPRHGSDSFEDQFGVSIPLEGPAKRSETKTSSFVRRPEVRRYVLLRAKGKCEYCGTVGFITTNGRIYLETHHIVPLHEEGPDSVGNVAALCPNHHREAHHGKKRAEIREQLQKKLASPAPKSPPRNSSE